MEVLKLKTTGVLLKKTRLPPTQRLHNEKPASGDKPQASDTATRRAASSHKHGGMAQLTLTAPARTGSKHVHHHKYCIRGTAAHTDDHCHKVCIHSAVRTYQSSCHLVFMTFFISQHCLTEMMGA